VLGALRRATGTPVSYAELREAGVEFPASVVSELELAGIPIERCRGVEGRGASVRLDPAAWARRDPGALAGLDLGAHAGLDPALDASDEPAGEARRPVTPSAGVPALEARPQGRRVGARALASVALLAVIVAVGTLIATALGGGGGGPGRPGPAARPHAKTVIAAHATHTTAATPPPTPPPPPTPVSLGLATQLEAQGHGLLESGSYGSAVAVLRRALLATGEDVTTCVEPASTMCLTYAYALYDLGRALRLSGDPAAAVPILEHRLEIDNQRPTVLAELELARRGTT
jgi:hypothetical protein